MKQKETFVQDANVGAWFLYILECNDGTLYTGITKDLSRRMEQHNTGRASKYTRVRRPVRLVYQEACRSRTHALIRECEVKELPRHKKLDLFS